MSDEQTAVIAHLLRRAGFGASFDELEQHADRPYSDVVEDLVNPERFPDIEEDILARYYPHLLNKDSTPAWNARWYYRMVNSRRPLQEKMALFWHHVFATGWTKSEHTPSVVNQIDMFRRTGLSNFRTILLELSKDPAMVYWLDNCENHAGSINENYGRELLELFSMGIGNYTEQDIKEVARAFTGWTFRQPIPLYPFGHYEAEFVYRPEDHDDGEKTFLGHTGRLNGEDIIDIIVRQEATARFLSRHIYNFFVADEPQVPAWSVIPPGDPEAVETLARSFQESDGDIRSVMRTLFNSGFFKAARYRRVKCPAEFVAGTLKLSGEFRFPDTGLEQLEGAATVMGQKLMDPPTVEGWHTGREWIDGGTLTERVNFAVQHIRNTSLPGPQAIIARLSAAGAPVPPDSFVEQTLDLVGQHHVGEETREALTSFAREGGDLRFDTDEARKESAARVGELLTLIVASREYQFA